MKQALLAFVTAMSITIVTPAVYGDPSSHQEHRQPPETAMNSTFGSS
jgi:hypothetical protein